MHELSQRTIQVTFDPTSAVISYQGNNTSGTFSAYIKKDTLEYEWEDTTLAFFLRTRRAISLEDDERQLEGIEPRKGLSTRQMSEILIQCIVVGPVGEPLEGVEGLF